VRISAPDDTIHYGPKTTQIDTVCGRKCPAFTTFTVRFRILNDAVFIDLGEGTAPEVATTEAAKYAALV
jgi:hypothetical protein